MCVTVAMKLPRDRKTGKPTPDAKWRLAKVRDRVYDAIYKVKRYTVKEHGASQLFLVDKDTDWSEGISVHADGSFLSMVNSSLNNYSDKKDGVKTTNRSGKSTLSTTSMNGQVIRKTLKSHDIEEAIKILVENKIDGCTLITDGDRLFVIETTLPVDVKNKYREQKQQGKRFEDIVPYDEYRTIVKEVKTDYLVVRTNHGVFDSSFGYSEENDGEAYQSSFHRRKYAIEHIEKSVFEPIDLITTLSKLGRESIDKNPFYRPIRLKGQTQQRDDDFEVYSTSIIQTDPSGTMIVKPIECEFDINNTTNLLSDKYLSHMVILPHRSKMFESFKEHFNRMSINKLLV